MRLRHAYILARMLVRFFSRKVLRLGVLRSTAVRVMALTALGVLLAAGVVGAYFFFRPMLDDPASWGLLFNLATVSVVLWAQMAFLLVKVLFINADGLLDLSFHLPLTNRERALAFLMYEATMAAIVAGAGFTSLIGASLLLRGPEVLPQVLESIVLPMLLTYAVMTVIHLALGRVAIRVGLRRVRNIVLILAVFGLLLTYASQLPHLTAVMSENYLSGDESFVWVAGLSWVSATYGTTVMLLVATGALALLVTLAVWLTPNEHVRHSRFVNVPIGRRAGARLSPYDLCLVRSSQTWLGVAVTVALYTALWIADVANPLWALTLLSIGGLYQFSATTPVRIMLSRRNSPWTVYRQLLTGQIGLVAVASVPATALIWASRPELLSGVPLAIAGSAAGAVITICIGIVFPAENDNPFSVFIGLAVTAAVLALVGISMGILQAPPPVMAGVGAGSLIVLSWYSVQAIRIDESRRRHETGFVGGQRSSRRRPFDLGRGRRGTSLAHVVDG